MILSCLLWGEILPPTGEKLALRLGVENLCLASSTGSGKRGSINRLDLREWIPLPLLLAREGVDGVR